MKKKISLSLIIITIFLFSSFAVNALIAGDEFTLTTLDKCEELFVDVSGTQRIDEGEYEIIDCEEISPNHWFCDCYNNYDLKIKTAINAYNTYTFNITYYYQNSRRTTSFSGGGGYYLYPSNEENENNKSMNNTDNNNKFDNSENRTQNKNQQGINRNETNNNTNNNKDNPENLTGQQNTQVGRDDGSLDIQTQGTGLEDITGAVIGADNKTNFWPIIIIALIVIILIGMYLFFSNKNKKPDYIIK